MNERAVQMARTVPIDALASTINDLLKDYQEGVDKNLGEIVKAVTKKGATTIKQQARSTFGGSGKYAAGWTSKFESGRVSKQGTIYNGSLPGLPHLLEHGHANRGGGRTPGRVHIANVEEMIINEFESKVKSEL